MNQPPDQKYRALWVTSAYPYAGNPIAGIFVQEHVRAVSLFDKITVLHLLERQRSIQSLWEIDAPAQDEHGEIQLVRVRATQSALPLTTFPIHILSAMSGLRKCQALAGHFDLVHAQSYRAGVPAAIIAKKLGVPLVITEHNSVFLRKALQGFEYHKAAFAYRSAENIMPVSTALQRAIQEYHLGKQFHVIGNTFDPGIFFPDAEKRKSKTLRLITVTNLIPLKGVSNLLHALKNAASRIPVWKLQTVGDGPEKSNLMQLASELGISNQISFSGTLTKPQIAEALRASDLFILPSLHETFSVATLEALACGVPVLATACGGPEDYITPENGKLVQPNSQAELEKGLAEITTRLDRFDQSNIAQAIHAKYSYQAIGEQIHQVYQSVVSNQRETTRV